MKALALVALLASAPALADCDTVPVHEPVAHHIKRVWHNLWHPAHREHFVPPATQLVCGEPGMPVVTIEAPHDPELNVPEGQGEGGYGPFVGAPTGSPPGGYAGGWASLPPAPPGVGLLPPRLPSDRPTQPVPEPGTLLVLATGVAALLVRTRRRK